MASSIAPVDPLMDMSSLATQTASPLAKSEAGMGKGFHDSLFAFEGPTLETLQSTEEASPPLQKEALAIKDKITSTPLETAETFLDEEVSMVALSYAMALQEKENQPLRHSQLLASQENESEFSDLTSALIAPSNSSLDSAPTAEPNKAPQEIMTSPQEAAQQVEAEISADPKDPILPPTAKTTPSSAKQAPLQETKTRDPLATSTSSTTGKETLSAVAPSQAHSEGNSKGRDHAPSQEETEHFNSEDTKNSNSSKGGKTLSNPVSKASFSETLSKATSSIGGSSSAQAGLTSLQSDALETVEGKDIEESFHRGSASIDTKTTSVQSTQQSTSQSALAQTASLQEQVALSIKNNAPKGKSEINLQLRPDSLGRLNIKIDINKEGQTFVVVKAESTATRDLLQKDSQQLIDLLEQSDLEISDENMFYSLFNDQERKDFEERREDSADINRTQGEESAVLDNTTAPLISLGMSEIQIPRHGGSWQAIA